MKKNNKCPTCGALAILLEVKNARNVWQVDSDGNLKYIIIASRFNSTTICSFECANSHKWIAKEIHEDT
jgi:hypothetical protein